jgi:hypothetical protein
MLLKPCLNCQYHQVHDESVTLSYCTKENCFAEHSRCIAHKALRQYLRDNQVRDTSQLTALDLLYPKV